MAIKSSIKNYKLILALNEDDYGVYNHIMQKWNFKDPESMLGFALTLLSSNDEDGFIIKSKGRAFLCKPNKEILKHKGTKLH